jgi:2-keto-3-deoxy-L-rhamnonate aldolase RhmA
MIETVEAYQHLDEILEVPGIDGVIVGPNDLAISHSGSHLGAGRSERDLGMVERIARACASRGLSAGTTFTSAEDAVRWQRLGYTLLGLPSDAALLGTGMVEGLAAARAACEAG